MSQVIPLGTPVRDVITKFSGIAVSRIEYLTGCTQMGVTPEAKDGKINDTQYFDCDRLEITGAALQLPMTTAGGPNRDAPR